MLKVVIFDICHMAAAQQLSLSLIKQRAKRGVCDEREKGAACGVRVWVVGGREHER